MSCDDDSEDSVDLQHVVEEIGGGGREPGRRRRPSAGSGLALDPRLSTLAAPELGDL